ncbi:signal transducer and activator of transcription 2 isoform X2 [Eublepharis macularius]|uniref:Signal transducer and activator of transcription n=1 Tax=Eublepharis macularius TaxID=481883 RepID=A0AA97J8T4_EUBMA|nr:signal transducer and activator of transcription 2 isoform X2 [Eublepharis macularius]
MSQWQQIQMLDSIHREQVHRLYSDDCLPMEVREYLAYWIEEQNWNQVMQSDCSQAYWLFQTMLAHLDDQLGRLAYHAENNSNMVLKHNLRRSKLDLQAKYENHPEELANIIDGLLREERAILAAAATANSPVEPPPDTTVITGQENNIEDRLAEMRKAVQGLKNFIGQLEDLQEIFDFRFKAYKILENSAPSDPSLCKKLNELQVLINNLDRHRKDVLAQIQALLGRSDTLRDLLLSELSKWKDCQRRACIGDVCDTTLQQLEKWCTGNAEDLFHLLLVLQYLEDLHRKVTYSGDPLPLQLPQLKQRLQEQISCLLKSAFVVESQPKMPFPSRRPLLLKTNNKFSVRVRLLVKLMDQDHKMEVKIEIDSGSANLVGFRRFNILPSTTKTMVKDRPQVQGLVCDFSHIMLKEQKPCGSGKGKGGKGASEGSLPITEELHVITFTLDYCYLGLRCQLQTSTLPVVIFSNVNQASSAWASILWFNMLGADPKNQLFFSNPTAATWAKLSEVLSWQFLDATKRGLDAEQLKMLGKKLCGPKVKPQNIITWHQFCKETCPPGENFSFWTWLDGILGLIQEHLLELWKNNLIMGFVSRKREKDLLKEKREGTFLLRFSETTRDGGITCTWVGYNNGSPTFRSVVPYTKAELNSLALPDIIHDYQLLAEEDIPENPLRFLYPDIPRNEAFGPYYSERREGDLMEQRKYLNHRLIRVSSRHPDEPRLPGVNLQEPQIPGVNPQEPRLLSVNPQELRLLSMNPQEPQLPGVNPQEPQLPGVNPQEPRLLSMNPQEPRLLSMNPQGPRLLSMNPQEPQLPGVNPQEPRLPGVNPQEPRLLSVNPQEPQLPGVNPQEPQLPGVNDAFPLDNMNEVNVLLRNVMLDGNDPFLPPPAEDEQAEYHQLFGLPHEMPELILDDADF